MGNTEKTSLYGYTRKEKLEEEETYIVNWISFTFAAYFITKFNILIQAIFDKSDSIIDAHCKKKDAIISRQVHIYLVTAPQPISKQ